LLVKERAPSRRVRSNLETPVEAQGFRLQLSRGSLMAVASAVEGKSRPRRDGDDQDINDRR
jgi:hypothetical protein